MYVGTNPRLGELCKYILDLIDDEINTEKYHSISYQYAFFQFSCSMKILILTLEKTVCWLKMVHFVALFVIKLAKLNKKLKDI